MLKYCGRCGEGFECRAGQVCWCEEIDLARDQLKWLKETYDACLCPVCLRLVSAGSTMNGAYVSWPKTVGDNR